MHWVIDEKASLAWWQINPHLGDLWGTTCPAESSWHAGRSGDPLRRHSTGYAGVLDTVIPVHPRPVAVADCVSAVSGEISAADTVAWQGVHGRIVVDARTLTSALSTRDNYARGSLLQTGSFPTIEYQLDSLTGVQRHGDTVTATGYGLFQLRGVRESTTVTIRAWHEPLGLRVTGHGEFPANDLIYKYKMSKIGLGVGVASHVWKQVHWGVDAILVPEQAAGAN